jgi:hypothetical protein
MDQLIDWRCYPAGLTRCKKDLSTLLRHYLTAHAEPSAFDSSVKKLILRSRSDEHESSLSVQSS